MIDDRIEIKICFAWLVASALFVCDTGWEALLFLPGAMFVAHTLYYRKVSLAVASPEYIRPLVFTALIKLQGSNLIYHKEDSEAIEAFKQMSDILTVESDD